MRLLRRAAALAVLVVGASAHLGSPDTWFEGAAGPYPVRVVVRLPGVIPGLAQIDITAADPGITRVTAQPVIFDAGKEGAPPPDQATPVPGRPGTYHAQLWFMTPGSFSVNVTVTGPKGEGTAVVPVAAVPERQIGLAPGLTALLLALGGLLLVGALTIFRAAASDGVTAPGAPLDPGRRRAGAVATVVGAVLLATVLWGGRAWWRSVAADYRRQLYQPFQASAAVDTAGGRRTLVFTITDSVWSSRRPATQWERFSVSPLVPDHGKLMHLFLIERGRQGAIAHLHPAPADSATFTARLGDLPPGRYDAFADVVHESGFPQTMVATVDVPAGPADSLADPDDAVFAGAPSGDTYAWPDGASIRWTGRPASIVAGADAGLRFAVRAADGSEARLEPYLGMAGHAVIERADGQVYIHLHPNGTISMAAQAALGSRQGAAPAMAGMAHPAFAGGLAFPYAFPAPGEYRVWIQVRLGGRIRTAPFAVTVH